MQHRYFAASNSSRGFKNYYPQVFSRADYVYIIKGGPGTGKSSFMKKYAEQAKEKGYECEYYFCSSDPSSLDGILIFGENRVIGMLDGTAPHVSEPKFPGAREEIINLGECWNSDLLRKQKNEIIALSERKSSEYKSAYTFLRSVGNLRAVSEGLLASVVDRQKIDKAINSLIKDIPFGKAKYLPAILDSVSMNGRVRLTTFEDNARKIYVTCDYYGVGEILLTELFLKLKERETSMRVSFDPISPERVDGIFLEEKKIAFVTGRGLEEKYELQKGDKTEDYEDFAGNRDVTLINTKRFVDAEKIRDARSELRYIARLFESSLDGALHSLSKAKIYHFLLEDIYGKAMDWEKFNCISIEI